METKRFEKIARAIVKNLNQYELWLLENLVVEYRTGEEE